jgi:ribosomal protein L21
VKKQKDHHQKVQGYKDKQRKCYEKKQGKKISSSYVLSAGILYTLS